jgi:hypothetical protein
MKKNICFLTSFFLLSLRVFSQSYAYDGNGNLSVDNNKQISSIHYNHLNLVDTVIYQDGRKIIYGYSGSGQKLEEQVLLADGSLFKKRDYVDGYLYTNDTLMEIHQEHGRLPVLIILRGNINII